MKTNELIEALRAELYDNKWCQQDFEKYDLPAIKESSAPFFWLCRINGTSLVSMDMGRLCRKFADHRNLFALFRNPNEPIEALLYYKTSAYPQKCFYWDGFNLQCVTLDDVEEIWHNLSDGLLEALREECSDEWAARDELLPVKFASGETEERYKKALEHSDSLADESLARCVERLTKHPRYSLYHHITIGSDFVEHGFTFGEFVDNKCVLSGGIIPDFHKGHDR